MIHTLSGKLSAVGNNFILLEVGGVGYKIFVSDSVLKELPQVESSLRLYTFLYLREDHVSLYGFLNEKDLNLFALLNGISGIGPKTALGILSLTSADKLVSAIKGGHLELLTKASGIGRKIAERIILELKEKITGIESGELVATMKSDADVLGALQNLGYAQRDAQEALQKVDATIEGDSGRLKAALKLLKK